jgi:HSP20 family molecular chaperone IbpA
VELPGAKKEDIDIQILPEGFMISTRSGDVECKGDYAFCCPVSAEKTKAEYNNDILKISIP